MRAAPVGVVVSCGSSTQRTRDPLRTSSVAGTGSGEEAMGGPDDAVAHRKGPAADRLRAEELERHAAAHHVDDGVHGADLMEGHILGVPAVDRALGTARSRKASRARADTRSGRPAPSTRSRMSLKVRWACCSGWVTVARSAATPLISTRSVARSKATPEVVERARDLAQRRPRRDEARESHVAGRAAHGLKVDVGQGARRRTRPRGFASTPLARWRSCAPP